MKDIIEEQVHNTFFFCFSIFRYNGITAKWVILSRPCQDPVKSEQHKNSGFAGTLH